MSGEGSESVCSSGDEDQGIEREESERGSGKESSDDNDDSAGPSGGSFESEGGPEVLTGLILT